MKKIERIQAIEKMAEGGAFVSITAIAEKIGASESTIRRDVKELADEGQVIFSNGGILWNRHLGSYLEGIRQQQGRNAHIKQAVARYAADIIKDGDCVYIESGTTLRELAKHLPSGIQVTVVTPDLAVALELDSRPDITTIMLGGSVLAGSHVVTGELANDTIKNMRFTKVFLSPNNISPEGDLMFTNILTATLRRYAMARTQQVIVLTNHTKFEATGIFSSGTLNDVDILISDSIPDRMTGKIPSKVSVLLLGGDASD